MTSNFFHVCFLVADLDAAVVRFSELLQIEFARIIVARAPTNWNGTLVERDVRVTYSTTLPYIELIEGHEDGYYGLQNGEGFHHMGVWAPDFGSQEWRDRFGSLDVEATVLVGPGDVTHALCSPSALYGVRLELVDERLRPWTERWVAG